MTVSPITANYCGASTFGSTAVKKVTQNLTHYWNFRVSLMLMRVWLRQTWFLHSSLIWCSALGLWPKQHSNLSSAEQTLHSIKAFTLTLQQGVGKGHLQDSWPKLFKEISMASCLSARGGFYIGWVLLGDWLCISSLWNYFFVWGCFFFFLLFFLCRLKFLHLGYFQESFLCFALLSPLSC